MKVLVTGSAGFIGYHLVLALLEKGFHVCGIDNINNYYDVSLKKLRLSEIDKFCKFKNITNNYSFNKIDISDSKKLGIFFRNEKPNIVINLAAQAGVRYSIDKPQKYVDSNLIGFVNIIEQCRHFNVDHFIFASSSSVYGMNKLQPFSTLDNTDYPVSLYAATKKSNELIAHAYSHLFDIPITGLRFFTVYGPNGRPDMAYFKFTEAIINNKSIDVYNHGKMKRDFTYIDDIVNSLILLIQKKPEKSSNVITNATSRFNIYNIGNNKPITLKRFIKSIETALDKKAVINNLPMQAGDVPITYANIDDLYNKIGFAPQTSIEKGMIKFVEWYKKTYNTNN
jgi:UDP-glucuronate 4-epimerase